MKSVRLKPDRERPVLRKHPWIFANSIIEVDEEPGMGETIQVYDHDGNWLAYAAFSPKSQIRARIWTWDPSEQVDENFLAKRIGDSIKRREVYFTNPEVTAYREVYAESDGVPGLIIDRYNDLRVIQILFAGAERWRDSILEILANREDCRGVYERSDVDIRDLEGLPARVGRLWGHEPEDYLSILEYGLQFRVDIRQGQKTGFYLDQRENRMSLRQMLTEGVSVLDCFCYSGGFTLNALEAGAGEVLAIDSSAASLELLEENVTSNGFSGDRLKLREGDVFSELRKLRDQDCAFDVIILDPPKFASTPSHVQRASRGYKDINILAFKLLKPGGLLFTFSCSGGVGPELFQKIVADAALDANRHASIIKWLGQPRDHPVLLSFPEARYLKGLVCQVHT